MTLAYDNIYFLCDKINVNINSFSSNEDVFERYNISDYLRDDMKKVIDHQKELGNDDLIIEVFAPSIAPDGIQLFGDEPLGERYYAYYYNGATHFLKDYSVKYSNLNTGMKEYKGTDTMNKAKSFVNFVISITDTGAISKIVSAFGIIGSAYDLYKSIVGEVYVGYSNDLINSSLIYDRILKETYVKDIYGEYPAPNYITYKAWLNRHDTYQYYAATGKSHFAQPSLNAECYSTNFKNPAIEAIKNTAYLGSDGFLYTTLLGNSVRLMGY